MRREASDAYHRTVFVAADGRPCVEPGGNLVAGHDRLRGDVIDDGAILARELPVDRKGEPGRRHILFREQLCSRPMVWLVSASPVRDNDTAALVIVCS